MDQSKHQNYNLLFFLNKIKITKEKVKIYCVCFVSIRVNIIKPKMRFLTHNFNYNLSLFKLILTQKMEI